MIICQHLLHILWAAVSKPSLTSTPEAQPLPQPQQDKPHPRPPITPAPKEQLRITPLNKPAIQPPLELLPKPTRQLLTQGTPQLLRPATRVPHTLGPSRTPTLPQAHMLMWVQLDRLSRPTPIKLREEKSKGREIWKATSNGPPPWTMIQLFLGLQITASWQTWRTPSWNSEANTSTPRVVCRW